MTHNPFARVLAQLVGRERQSQPEKVEELLEDATRTPRRDTTFSKRLRTHVN